MSPAAGCRRAQSGGVRPGALSHAGGSRACRAPTPSTLTQGNVYILPTRAGWMFALTLLVLLLASINYQLNLGYVLTFLLAGSGVVSMHVTPRHAARPDAAPAARSRRRSPATRRCSTSS